MATVYLAYDLRHAGDVAIKVLHPDLGAALGADRFLSEIRTTARLQHPHILPLLDSGDAGNGLLYYVMPVVTGETLRARLERETQLPIPDVVRIARDVASALEYAHRQGVIHRDIKPENILLHDGSALVADFGIARAVQSAGGARMTQTGLSLGTPQYMSPEQAMGERTIDARSDIYALGAMTYEMLAGDAPFTGSTVQAIVAKVLSERPTALHTVRDTVPPHVEQAVLTALAKLPADRQASAAEFGAALAATGAMPTIGRQGADARRGRPRTNAMLLLGACALVGVTAATTWLLTRRLLDNTAAGDVVTRFTLEGHNAGPLQSRIMALAPDGQSLVYRRIGPTGAAQLVVRRFDQRDAVPIPRSIGAFDPTFSPDGQWVAYAVDRDIYRVKIGGGDPVRLAALAFDPTGLAWTSTGDIVLGSTSSRTLFAMREDGGSVRTLPGAPEGRVALWPMAVAGSDVVLFVANKLNRDSLRVLALSLHDGTVSDVGTDAFMVVGVARGQLVYLQSHRRDLRRAL